MANAAPTSSAIMHGFLYGMYLKDLEVFKCRAGIRRLLHPGEIVHGRRSPSSESECGVVLGFGVTKEEAKKVANAYMREVGRLHNAEDLDELEVGETQLDE